VIRPHQRPSDSPVSGEALFGRESAHYARYRPGVPEGAVRLLVATQNGIAAPVLLDLGTGTGQVPLALLPALPRLTHLHLVDINQRMLEQALIDLEPIRDACTVSGFVGEAQAFPPPDSSLAPSLITCCRAFHWMDRPAVLDMAARVSTPDVVVAVMGDGSLWNHDADWTTAVRELIQTHLGRARRAGTQGTYTEPSRTFQDELAASAFTEITRHTFPVTRTWTPEKVVGYLRTTSYARPVLFADRHNAFEAEALDLLHTYAHDGVLREDAVFEVILARRPGGAA
jgi:ubiquinone/menaquinone biosynthesis C-methylase UbiE